MLQGNWVILLLSVGNRDWLRQSIGDLLFDEVALLLWHIEEGIVLLILLNIETMFVNKLGGDDHKLCAGFLWGLLFCLLVWMIAVLVLHGIWDLHTFAVVDLGLLERLRLNVNIGSGFLLAWWVQSLVWLVIGILLLLTYFLGLGCWDISLGWGFCGFLGPNLGYFHISILYFILWN